MYGSVALLWHNAKVLALSKVLALTGYNQNFFIINPILMKLGETWWTCSTHCYYNITKFYQNQMKNKKVSLIAHFSVPNFKVSVESWKSYIVCGCSKIVVLMDNYNFTKFHQNQMKNKKVLLTAHFSVQNFKVSVESWKSYIHSALGFHIYKTWQILKHFVGTFHQA